MDLCYDTNSKNSTHISLKLFGLTHGNSDWYLDSKVNAMLTKTHWKFGYDVENHIWTKMQNGRAFL